MAEAIVQRPPDRCAKREVINAPAIDYLPQNPRGYYPAIGLIGCGNISEYHLQAYRAAGYRVVALCSRNIAKAHRRRQQFFPDAEVYSQAEELLARDDIEVVDIATPPTARVPVIQSALSRRKHVLSQKPFVTDLDVGLQLIEMADRQRVRLAVNQNARWAPHLSYIRGAVAAGCIGQVFSVHFSLHWDHDWIAETPFNDVRHVILFDYAIHWFDLLSGLLPGQPAREVYASLIKAPCQRAREPLLAQAVIGYDKVQASVVLDGNVIYGAQDRTYLAGTSGTLTSVGPSLAEQQVCLETATGIARPKLQGTWFCNGFHGAMAELLCAIEDGREPCHSARMNLNSVALALAAVASADTGRPIVPGAARALPIVH